MFCRICGKPVTSYGRCFRCGHQYDGYRIEIPNGEKNASVDFDGSDWGENEAVSEMPQNDGENGRDQGAKQGNNLATIGMILAFCSLVAPMLILPSLIVNGIALAKAKKLDGDGQSKATIGLVVSGLVLAILVSYYIYMFAFGYF